MRLDVKENERHFFKSLMTNKDFRDWVHNPTENRNHYWEKWTSLNEDKQELVKDARNAVLKLRFKEDLLPYEKMENILNSIISDQGTGIHPDYPDKRQTRDSR